MFLHSWHPHPLIATIAGFPLHWYGLMLALAALVGIWLMVSLGRRYQLESTKLFDLALYTLVAGFIGARIYHLFNEVPYYFAHPLETYKVWNGGLALHGGLLFGFLTVLFYARRWKWNPWLVLDIMAPAMAVAQAIGRWGNYFNQELFGKPTSLPWGIPIDVANRPSAFLGQTYFHPTFLYESLGLLVIAAILWWMHSRRLKQSFYSDQVKFGVIGLSYLILYSTLRIATETLRLDRTPVIGGLRLPILVSVLIIILTAIAMATHFRRPNVTPSVS